MARRVAAAHPALICRLVGIAVESLSLDRVREAILARQLTPETAAAVLSILEDHVLLPLDATLDGELLMRLETIDGLYTDDGQGDGRLVINRLDNLGGSAAPVSPSASGNERTHNRFASKRQVHARDAELDGIMRRMASASPHERTSLGDELEHELARRAPLIPIGSSNMLLSVLYPAIGRALQADDQHALHLAATRIMLAIELHRAQHDAVPPTLDALAPDSLPSIPLDPFRDEHLIYRPDPDSPLGYTLYSAGLDRTDDGGRPHPESAHRALNRTGPGTDFLYVPPAR
ncbi:MAG: hypothetical protein KJZ54_13675 [Phycisphaerales bacterium]|nr:hypothetical protein [Phycisphaerales bacterium]